MKMTILLSFVFIFVCNAKAEIFIITEKPTNYKIEKKKVEIGKQCVEWDVSGPEKVCLKEKPKFVEIEVATIELPDEDNDENSN